jgi:hypothetical protein
MFKINQCGKMIRNDTNPPSSWGDF